MEWTRQDLYKFVVRVIKECGGGGTGTDELVKVSSNDSVAGLLNGKLVAGSNITLVENNDGGNETFTINAVGGVAGEVNSGVSLGGEAIYSGKVGVDLQFKGIVAGTGITFTPSATSITINGSGEANSGSNLGTGAVLFAGKTGVNLQFKSLIAGDNVFLDVAPNAITINALDTGEVNTASNLGAGEGIFASKLVNDLRFKSLVGGTNVNLVSDGNTITINSTDTGEVNTASNLGAGANVFASKVGVDFRFKTLIGGTNVSLVQGADTITINATGSGIGEVNTASNQGGGEELFIQKTGVDLEFKTIVAGSNITLTPGANTLTIASSGGGSSFAWYNAGNNVFVYSSGTNTTTSKSAGLLTINGNNDEIRSFRFVGGASDLNSGELTIRIDNNGAQDGVDYNTSDLNSIWPHISVQNRTVVLPSDPYQQKPDDAGDSIDVFDERFSIAARVTKKITGLAGDFGIYGFF